MTETRVSAERVATRGIDTANVRRARPTLVDVLFAAGTREPRSSTVALVASDTRPVVQTPTADRKRTAGARPQRRTDTVVAAGFVDAPT